jgi:hypothetical protein
MNALEIHGLLWKLKGEAFNSGFKTFKFNHHDASDHTLALSEEITEHEKICQKIILDIQSEFEKGKG